MILTLLLLQGPALAPVDLTGLIPGDPGEKTINIGGRFMEDFSFFSGGEDLASALDTTFDDGVETRRARIRVFGNLAENIAYKMEYDWAGGTGSLKDAYLKFKTQSVGNVILGHQYEMMGLEQQTSSRFITFIERSSLTDAFMPERNAGISLWHSNDDYTASIGWFRDTDSQGKSGDESTSFTGRFVYRPWIENKGQSLLHVGLSASQRNTEGGVDYDARPDNHFISKFVDTGALSADDALLLAFELAVQEGPFHAMFEYAQSDVSATTGVDPSFSGWSLQGGYFLTGESRGYKTGHGVFDRVKPTNNALTKEGGVGAWEIAARYSNLDLTEAATVSDELDTMTLALNWYVNPNTRFMLDATKADMDSFDSTTIIALRVAFDF
jgi:phosphate-selective porin OprO/OprP